MRHGKQISFIALFLVSWQALLCQQPEFFVSGPLSDLPFSQFAEKAEQEIPVRFYYRDEWVRGIRVTVPGDSLALTRILDRVLLPVGISYYLDFRGEVYLSPYGPLNPRLPDYTQMARNPAPTGELSGKEGTAGMEQTYLEGRKSGMLEILEVGISGQGNGVSGAVVNGMVTDAESGEPVVGATLYVEELRRGTATDSDGRYSLEVPVGSYTLEVNSMGMDSRRSRLEVHSSGTLELTLEKELIPLDGVTIRSDRYQNVRGTQMGMDRLNYKLLKEVPAVMGERDALKVALLLPGVQSVGEGAAGFHVRGGSADQNLVLVNRIPVYNPNHLFGFFTSISPDIVRDFTLYKSHMPARFGGRASSVFDISTRQGSMSRFGARGGISPVTAHMALDGPIRKDRSAYALSVRSSYSDWILRRLEDPDLRNSTAGFYDLSGGITWETGERTLLKIFGYGSSDRFRLGETNRYEYANSGTSLLLRHRFRPRITGTGSLVYSRYDFQTEDLSVPPESYSHRYRIGHSEFRGDVTWLSRASHTVSAGLNAVWYALDRGRVQPAGPWSLRAPVDLGRENGLEYGLYLADEWELPGSLTLYAGIRFSGFLSLGPRQVLEYPNNVSLAEAVPTDTLMVPGAGLIEAYQGPEPRVSLQWMTGSNSSVKISYNRLRQYLFMLSNTIAVAPTDQWKLTDSHLEPPVADQVSLGFYVDFPGAGIHASAEAYRKWISGVAEYRDGADFIRSPHAERMVLQGDQDAWGAEWMVRKPTGRLNGWIGYSYSRSFTRVDSPFPSDRINGGEPYPSNYDRPHSVDLVVNYRLNRRLSFSSNLSYATGRPVTYPISVFYLEWMQFLDYSSRNQYRLPDYFRMDFSINLEGNLRKQKPFHSFWMLNVFNATGRRNAYSVFFRNESGAVNGYRLSVFGRPVITLSWNIKLGNYASD